MNQRKFDPTKEELEKLYQFHPCGKIGAMFGVNAETVRKRLHEHGIASMKRGGRRAFDPDREVLSDLYQKMSMLEIAKHFGVGETVVFTRLKEHGIELKEHKNHRLKPGRAFSQEHRENLAKSQRGKVGEESRGWKGGLTEINRRARTNWQAKEWKKNALVRANHQCEQCGTKDGQTCECCGTKVKLHVHHIKSFAKFIDDRYDPANSEVLCPKCHHAKHH